jgi:crotonobetaine/carnitine-CoA ligase
MPQHAHTINATFRSAVAEQGDRTYLTFSGSSFSYDRLALEVERFARGLAALGVKPGDRVVALLDNGPDAVIAWYATNRLGGIYVPINTAYKGEFLRHQVSDSGGRILVCENDYLGDVLAVASECPAVAHILHTGPARPVSGIVSTIDAHRLDHGELPEVAVQATDLSLILYTSGTTGLSKGCMVSHGYLCDVSRRYCETIGRRPDDIVWTPVPLFHITGISLAILTMQLGSSAAYSRRFSVTNLWPDIEHANATFVVLLGTMALMIANAPDSREAKRCFGQVRTVIGIPMSQHVANIWRERFGVTWCSGAIYGSTEVGQALNARYDLPIPDGSCGRVNDTFDVRIVDDNDEELPPNIAGEIVVRPKRSNVMFSGYWNNPEATLKIWRNLWHHMGDRGRVDENGNFFFVDRSKDVIRRRGENISSFELEATFCKHPDILEVDVKATIVRLPGAQLTEADLLEWARPRIPRFALPRYVEFRDSLPKNASGRVLKFQLREQGVTKSTWDRDKA